MTNVKKGIPLQTAHQSESPFMMLCLLSYSMTAQAHVWSLPQGTVKLKEEDTLVSCFFVFITVTKFLRKPVHRRTPVIWLMASEVSIHGPLDLSQKHHGRGDC